MVLGGFGLLLTFACDKLYIILSEEICDCQNRRVVISAHTLTRVLEFRTELTDWQRRLGWSGLHEGWVVLVCFPYYVRHPFFGLCTVVFFTEACTFFFSLLKKYSVPFFKLVVRAFKRLEYPCLSFFCTLLLWPSYIETVIISVLIKKNLGGLWFLLRRFSWHKKGLEISISRT